MSDKSKYVGFRCPTKIYKEVLEPLKNNMNKSMSKFIKEAIISHNDKEYRESLLNGYTQLTKLFKQISRHFAPELNRSKLEINELVFYIKENITNPDTIDYINKRLGLD